MDTLAAYDLQLDATEASPGSAHDAIVYGSIGMIAAATGLGIFYEAGAAGWLSVTAGSVTALLLAAGHLSFAAPKAAPKKKRVRKETPHPATTPQAIEAVAKVEASAMAPEVARVEPSASASRQPTHGLPPQKVAAPAIVAPPAPTAAKPDIELAQLELLVRQMAANAPGPKAVLPDPDRTMSAAPVAAPAAAPVATMTLQAIEPAPSLRVGFGAPAVAADMGARVATAVAAERVDVLLAPIQNLGDGRARHFEVLVRLRDEDGAVLSDTDVAEVARTTGLAGAIDALKLPRVARVARKVQGRGGSPADVMAGVFGDSLTDRAFIDALDMAMTGPTSPPIVLAFTQADVRAFGRVHWWALATLSDIGLHFAIADLTDLDMDFDLLAARGFKFAKLDADVFLNGLPHSMAVIPAADLTRHLSTVGLQIIVGNINAEEQMTRLAGCGVALGQGRLFGEAKPVRREILEG